MNFQNYTKKSLDAIQRAQGIGAGYGNQSLQPEHLLVALLEQDNGLIPGLVTRCGGNPDALHRDLEGSSRISRKSPAPRPTACMPAPSWKPS